MASENDDIDNLRIANTAMSHDPFPSENEDIDNMRRVAAAGVPLTTPGLPWNRGPGPSDRPPNRTLGASYNSTYCRQVEPRPRTRD